MVFGFFGKKKNTADKIFYNANVYTMDQVLPWAEAVAVKDGEITAVGHYDEMDDLVGGETELIDLEGAYMLPGFIDIHRSPVLKMMNAKCGEEQLPGKMDAEVVSVPDDDYRFDPFNLSGGINMPEIEEIESGGTELGEIELGETDNAKGEAAQELHEPNDERDEEEIWIEEALNKKGELGEDVMFEIDYSETDEAIKETLLSLSRQGVTTALNIGTPHQIESEFEERLVEFYTHEKLSQRFIGSLYLNIPAPGAGVKSMLSQRRNLCSELDDMIKNEVLYIELDNAAKREKITLPVLEDIMLEASDRGFIIFIEAFGYDEMLLAYKALDTVRNKGYKNNIIIASGCDLKDGDRAELSSDISAYKTWRSNIEADDLFSRDIEQISDAEEAIEHITLEAAEMIGMSRELGSIEKGKYADFVVFREDPTEMSLETFSKQTALKTIIAGETVYEDSRKTVYET